MASSEKDPGAFRTIGELSAELGVAQHILRYWETKFPQLRPLQRAGNRRYYRPADAELARRINQLLTREGYTIRGVQKLLSDRNSEPAINPVEEAGHHQPGTNVSVDQLRAIRDRLQQALDDQETSARVFIS